MPSFERDIERVMEWLVRADNIHCDGFGQREPYVSIGALINAVGVLAEIVQEQQAEIRRLTATEED